MTKVTNIHQFSEKGIRETNEDSILPVLPTVKDNCFIVCDGMGGHEHGEVASRTIAESMAAYFQALPESVNSFYIQQALDYAVEQLNRKDIFGSEDKMGTTVVLAVLTESSVIVGHAGDSRLYHIRPGVGLLFRTKDHSQVQEWIDAEIITEEEARIHPKRNIITRCVQPHPKKPVVMEIHELDNIQTGDYIFLCTDGVTGAINDEEIVFMISNNTVSDEEKISYLKDTCAGKSEDNYSGFLLKIEVEPLTVPVNDVDLQSSYYEHQEWNTDKQGIWENNHIYNNPTVEKKRKNSIIDLFFKTCTVLLFILLVSGTIFWLLPQNEKVKPVHDKEEIVSDMPFSTQKALEDFLMHVQENEDYSESQSLMSKELDAFLSGNNYEINKLWQLDNNLQNTTFCIKKKKNEQKRILITTAVCDTVNLITVKDFILIRENDKWTMADVIIENLNSVSLLQEYLKEYIQNKQP